MLTNLQLVAFCEQVYAEKWVYWYGTCGYACTKTLYDRKKIQYPSEYEASRTGGYMADIAGEKMCSDCVGLIKAFFWLSGNTRGQSKYQANGCPDTNANGMFALCKTTGPIGTIPDVPGLVVHKPGHIGVYVGGGYTIEMRGFAYDCVKRKVTAGPWTEWGYLPPSLLQYVDGAVEVQPEKVWTLGERDLSKGCMGTDVTILQEALMSLGYALDKYGDDGDYGSETAKAVMAFQSDWGLDVTGVFDTAALKALNDALAGRIPEAEGEKPDAPEGGSEPAAFLVIGDRSRAQLEVIRQIYGGRIYFAAGPTAPDENEVAVG